MTKGCDGISSQGLIVGQHSWLESLLPVKRLYISEQNNGIMNLMNRIYVLRKKYSNYRIICKLYVLHEFVSKIIVIHGDPSSRGCRLCFPKVEESRHLGGSPFRKLMIG